MLPQAATTDAVPSARSVESAIDWARKEGLSFAVNGARRLGSNLTRHAHFRILRFGLTVNCVGACHPPHEAAPFRRSGEGKDSP